MSATAITPIIPSSSAFVAPVFMGEIEVAVPAKRKLDSIPETESDPDETIAERGFTGLLAGEGMEDVLWTPTPVRGRGTLTPSTPQSWSNGPISPARPIAFGFHHDGLMLEDTFMQDGNATGGDDGQKGDANTETTTSANVLRESNVGNIATSSDNVTFPNVNSQDTSSPDTSSPTTVDENSQWVETNSIETPKTEPRRSFRNISTPSNLGNVTSPFTLPVVKSRAKFELRRVGFNIPQTMSAPTTPHHPSTSSIPTSQDSPTSDSTLASSPPLPVTIYSSTNAVDVFSQFPRASIATEISGATAHDINAIHSSSSTTDVRSDGGQDILDEIESDYSKMKPIPFPVKSAALSPHETTQGNISNSSMHPETSFVGVPEDASDDADISGIAMVPVNSKAGREMQLDELDDTTHPPPNELVAAVAAIFKVSSSIPTTSTDYPPADFDHTSTIEIINTNPIPISHSPPQPHDALSSPSFSATTQHLPKLPPPRDNSDPRHIDVLANIIAQLSLEVSLPEMRHQHKILSLVNKTFQYAVRKSWMYLLSLEFPGRETDEFLVGRDGEFVASEWLRRVNRRDILLEKMRVSWIERIFKLLRSPKHQRYRIN
jgi:hypothetical protein